jgi:hypothetical protein
MIMDEKNSDKLLKAWGFLNDHPALIGNSLGNSLSNYFWFSPYSVCKRGYLKEGPISIYLDSKHRNGRWEKEFKKKFGDKIEKFDCIYKSYKEVFEEEWEFDHLEYWYEITFSVFQGDTKSKEISGDWFKNWNSYCGPEGSALTFEGIVIDAAEKIKKCFGDFNSYDSFLTSKEKINHKKYNSFNFVPIDKKDSRGKPYSKMIDNPKYITVTVGEFNRRWLKWYVKTDHCKKNWKGEFDKLAKTP